MWKVLSPGDLVGDAAGLPDGEQRAVLRMFINTLVWGGVAAGIAIAVLV